MKSSTKDRLKNIALFIFFLAFYIIFAILDGPMVTKDSPSYILMSSSREPFYPVFLAFNRFIFGEEKYLFIVIIIQNILWAFSNYSIVKFIKKTFDFKLLFSFLSVCVCLAPSIFLRFIAARGYLYSNAILTEGICIPLFILFAKCMLDYIFNPSKNKIILPVIVSLILISSRKQMLITLMLMMIFVILKSILWGGNKQTDAIQLDAKQAAAQQINESLVVKTGKIRKIFNGIAIAILLALIVLVGNRAFEYAYSYALYGTFATHSSDDRFFATVMFYVAEREDAESIKNEEARELFIKIYDICDAEGDMMHSATGSIMEKANYYAEHYDCIQIDHLWPEVESYVSNVKGINDTIEREAYVDSLMNDMMYGVLPNVLPELGYVFLASFLHGFANTVATSEMAILHYYSILVAIMYIVCWIYIIVKKKGSNVMKIGMYTLLSVVFNIALVSVVIFCQNRYMIYNMSLFYLTLLAMMHEIFKAQT